MDRLYLGTFMQRVIPALALLFIGSYTHAQIPLWLEDFRDAVYNQELSIGLAEGYYREAEKQAKETLTGYALYSMLSRCEYLLGRVYQDQGRNTEAVNRFETGMDWAKKSLAIADNAAAYEMLASHIGQLCMIKSKAWVMVNGLKVEENAKKARQLDGRNAGALYLLASRWAFGPGPFGNPERGITELEAMLNGQADLQKDDYFNVYSAMGYACIRLNRNQEALSWVQKSLVLYPSNKFALDLQSQIEQKLTTAK